MASIDHPNFATQLASMLRISRKTQAVDEHWALATNANFNQRLIKDEFDETIDEENIGENNAIAENNSQRQTIRGLFARARRTLERGLFPIFDADLDGSAVETSAVAYLYQVLGNGQVTKTKNAGKWGVFRDQMVTDAEVVLENGLVFGALTALGTPEGALTIASVVGEDHTFSGVVTLECTQEVIGATQFTVTLKYDAPPPDLLNVDGTTVIVNADNPATIAQSWEDGPTGLGFTLGFGTVITTDPDAMFSAEAFTIVAGSSGDLDGNGDLFVKVSRQSGAPIWLIEFFNNAERQPSQLVGSVTTDTVVGSFTPTSPIILNGGTGITFTFDRAAANTAIPAAPGSKADIQFGIDNPRIGDVHTFTVTNDEAGNYATKFGKTYRASLNSGPVPSASYTDAQASSLSMT